MMAKKVQEFQDMMKEMQLDHKRELAEKDDLLMARQRQWEKSRQEETHALKAKMLVMEYENEKDMNALLERDDVITRLNSDNAKLQAEKVELSRRVEDLVAMYNEDHAQLKAKTFELGNSSSTVQKEYETKLSQKENEIKQLQSQLAASRSAAAASNKGPDAELLATNNALKRDLTSAVESSISRGKEIQVLQNEIDKLTKANQRMKRVDKSLPVSNSFDSEEKQRIESELNCLRMRAAEAENEKQHDMRRLESMVNDLQALVEEAEQERELLENEIVSLQSQTENAKEEKQQLEFQLNSLRSHAQETEETISTMREEISTLCSRVSQSESIELDLTNARLALADSQSRIFDLEEALKETQVALKVVSSARLKGSSPAGSPAKEGRKNVIRKHIENDVLKEYVSQRM
jgi:DNA repair exonuclease SbcCD ATPase subunit